jgi:cell division septation protein DedD
MVNPDRNLYDPPYDDALLYDTEMEPERPRSRSLIVMLAFVVLAAFAGVVWVAYNQGVQMGQRGVNPPVLTADPGPVRVEPIQTAENGANPAPEKSYERLWAGESTEPSSGQVQPQPGADREAPTSQDVVRRAAPGESAIGGPEKVTPIDPGMGSPIDPGMDSTVELTKELPGEEVPGSGPAMTQLNMDRPQRMSKPGREDVTSLLPQASGGSGPVVEDSTTPSVSRPSVTQAAPSAVRPAKPIAPVAPPAPEIQSAPEAGAIAAPEEAAPASSGGATIQLGSFPSSALAAAQWSKVKGANQELLGTYSPQIVEASIPDKGVWYRLRVGGFADKSAAKSVCQQLSAAGQACILAGK